MTTEAARRFDRPFLAATNIVASNDINEESLNSLADQVRGQSLCVRVCACFPTRVERYGCTLFVSGSNKEQISFLPEAVVTAASTNIVDHLGRRKCTTYFLLASWFPTNRQALARRARVFLPPPPRLCRVRRTVGCLRAQRHTISPPLVSHCHGHLFSPRVST